MVGIIDFNKVTLYIFPFFPRPLSHLLCNPPHNWYAFFTQGSHVCRLIMDICIYCWFVNSFVQICSTEDPIGSIMLIWNKKIGVVYWYGHSVKSTNASIGNPYTDGWWNPCFIRNVECWYPKGLETTFRIEHFLNFNKINSKNSIYIVFLCEK